MMMTSTSSSSSYHDVLYHILPSFELIHDWIIAYLVDPSSLLSHLAALWLLVALSRHGVPGRRLVVLGVIEEALVYLQWVVVQHSLGAAALIWVFIKLYEVVVSGRVEIRERAVFLIGEADINEVTRSAETLNFDLNLSEEGGTINSNLLSVVFYNNSTRATPGCSDDVIPIDDVTDISKGCTASRRCRLGTVDVEVNRCLSVTLCGAGKTIVLIADDIYSRDRWVEFLTQCSGCPSMDVRATWLEKLRSCALSDDVTTDDAKTRDVTLDEALDVLNFARRPFDRQYALELFKNLATSNGSKSRWSSSELKLSADQLYAFFTYAVHRPEIAEIFERIGTNISRNKALSHVTFSRFIRHEQKEDLAQEVIKSWIALYEPVLTRLNLSQIGFTNYLLAEEHSVFKRECATVYQDMTHPLSHYFISTSHNTYLTKDQLKSKSSVEAYVSALRRGCKCVELDIWDGTNNEPIIYHGHTLTSKILVKDVLQAIRDHAFCVSRYPVILSFENHCSVEQQKIVAQYLRDILGEMLYTKPVAESEKSLPSPEDLLGYILVKSKKIKLTCSESVDDPDDDDDEFLDELPDDEIIASAERSLSVTSSEVSLSDVTSLKSENDDDEFTSSEAIKARKLSKLNMLIEISNNLRRTRSKDKSKAGKIAQEFSDLIVYCQAIRFRSFEYCKQNGRHYEMMSLHEKRAMRVSKEDPIAWLQYNERQLSRIYPSGSRIDSSNYDPIALWNVGCQLVALNYQTPSSEMQINQAQFNDNGRCGYVLKPEFLRTTENITFDPRQHSSQPIILSVLIISGTQIPYKSDKILKSERQLCVQVRVGGVEQDSRCERTKYVKNTGLNPVWNDAFVFNVRVPELAFISFTVLTKDVFTAQYTLPYRCMQQGYRRVPLQNKFSEPHPSSYLLIHSTSQPSVTSASVE